MSRSTLSKIMYILRTISVTNGHLTYFFQAGPDANLTRFQGSSSISSAEYFGRDEVPISKSFQISF